MNFGKYELLVVLGEGSIAEVFKAKSFGAEGFEKLLVIKRIKKKFSEDNRFSECFVRDTQSAILLNHANIIQVFDVGKANEQFYLAMEYVQGLTLSMLIRECKLRGTVPPLELVAFVGAEVAKGLDFAHRKRGRNLKPLDIVHKDISSDAVLVSTEGEVKISDFGLDSAKLAVSELVEPVSRSLYKAPEQIIEGNVDRRSDIFSLGVLLYELAGLTHPFANLDAKEFPDYVKHKRFPSASTFITKERDIELAKIIDKAISYEPSGRFQDAGAFYESLIAYIYHTGTRVGAHSLADFAKEMLTVEISVNDYKPLEDDVLKEAFRSSLAPDALSSAIASNSSDSLVSAAPSDAPDPQRREAALMAIDFGDSIVDEFNFRQFVEIIENNGGVLLSAENSLAVAVFGLDLASGRETEEALDAAFRIRRAAVVQNTQKGLNVKICVNPIKISVSPERTILENSEYHSAYTKCVDSAGLAEEGVITTKAGRRLSGGAYYFEAINSESTTEENDLYHVIGRVPLTESYGRLFGRHENLRAIGTIFSEVSASKGGVLTIKGPAGIGKTRLIREGQWRLLSGGQDVGWFEVVCSPFGRGQPFGAVAALFRAITALEYVETVNEIREKTNRLRELGLAPEEVEVVAALLGAPPSSDDDYYIDAKRLLNSAVSHLAAGLSSDRTLVLVFDNADDMDTDSLDVLRNLAENLGSLPVLLCLVYRDEVPTSVGSLKNKRNIDVVPLSKTNADQLTAQTLDIERASASLSGSVFQVTKGNPAFIEAYALSLLQSQKIVLSSGTADFKDNKHDVNPPRTADVAILKTIHALSDDERMLLECASLMGRTFNLKLQKYLSKQETKKFRSSLALLKKKKLLYRSSANEFTFSSSLFRDIVYQSIPENRRAAMHLDMVRAMEKIFESRLDFFATDPAVHSELGQDFVKAIEYYTKAGKKAAEFNADKTALDFYIKALELLQTLPDIRPESILSVCLPIGRLAIRANAYELGLEKIQAAEWIAEDVTDKETLIRILLLTSELHAHCEHIVETDWYMEWAMDLSRQLDDKGLSFDVLEAAGQVYFLLGDMKQAEPRYREAIEMARRDPNIDKNQLITCMAQLAKVEAGAGELEKSVTTLSEAEELLDEDSDLLARCEIEKSRGRAFVMAGNYSKAIESQLRLLEIAREYGLKDYQAETTHDLGKIYLDSGDMAKSFAYLTMSSETADEIGMKHLKNINALLLGYIDAIELGGSDYVSDMEELLMEAIQRDAVWEQLHLLFYLSKLHMEKGRHAVAAEYLQQLINLGAKVNNRLYHNRAEEMLKEIKVFAKLAD